jgi:hypothetical protein
LQVNIFRMSRHGLADSVASARAIETFDIGRGLRVIAIPRSTFFQLDRDVPGA